MAGKEPKDKMRERKTPLPIRSDMESSTPPPFYSKLRRRPEDSQRESDPEGILPPLIRPAPGTKSK